MNVDIQIDVIDDCFYREGHCQDPNIMKLNDKFQLFKQLVILLNECHDSFLDCDPLNEIEDLFLFSRYCLTLIIEQLNIFTLLSDHWPTSYFFILMFLMIL